jgi:hypothetical protein
MKKQAMLTAVASLLTFASVTVLPAFAEGPSIRTSTPTLRGEYASSHWNYDRHQGKGDGRGHGGYGYHRYGYGSAEKELPGKDMYGKDRYQGSGRADKGGSGKGNYGSGYGLGYGSPRMAR